MISKRGKTTSLCCYHVLYVLSEYKRTSKWILFVNWPWVSLGTEVTWINFSFMYLRVRRTEDFNSKPRELKLVFL